MDQVVTTDNLIRADTSLEALAKLKPVFDKRYGSVTAGNASPLTDGAAVVLMMEEEKARALGIGRWRRFGATPWRRWIRAGSCSWGRPTRCPRRSIAPGSPGRTWAWSRSTRPSRRRCCPTSQAWAIRRPGPSSWAAPSRWARSTGTAPTCMGGSIAIGHPFGATGARLATTLANEMVRRDVQFGLISICAQGGMGFAMVLERV